MSSGTVSARTRMTGAFAAATDGVVGREDHFADRGARGCRQADRDLLQALAGGRHDHRVQKLVELHRVDAQHGFLLVDQAFLGHVDGDLDGRRTRALAVAGLEHEQLAFLNGELEILDVAIVLFEAGGDFAKLLVDFRHHRSASSVIGFGVRMPATTSSPCALIRNSP